MPACSVPELVLVKSETTILVPSGDQLGFCSLEKLSVTSGIIARPEPSGRTTNNDFRLSNKMVFPSGDQRPPSSQNGRPHGVIRRRPLPSTLTTKSATFALAGRLGSMRLNTSRLPSGE